MVGVTGMQQPEKSFEESMSEDLLGYQPMVDRWLRARFHSIYSQSLAFDCWSSGTLDVLQIGYTGLDPDKRQHQMFKSAFNCVNDTYHHATLQCRMHDGYYTKQHIDFTGLNPEFANYLTLKRRRVWKLRHAGQTVSTIAATLGMRVNTVCVYCYQLRRAYAAWISMLRSFSEEYLSYVPDNRYYRDVTVLRYKNGYSINMIAEKLGIGPRYVCTTLYRVREVLKQKGIHLPSCWTKCCTKCDENITS